MNTNTINSHDIVIVTIKVIPATNTKGTRMKVSHGRKHGAKTIGYHSVNGFEEAAVNYMSERYSLGKPRATQWTETGRDTVAVALVY